MAVAPGPGHDDIHSSKREAYDGKTAWQVSPFEGRKDPNLVSADSAKHLVEDSDIDGQLVDYKNKDHRAELIGHDSVEGTDCYKIKLTMANGDARYYYIDTDSFLDLKVETERNIRGTVQYGETLLGDYEEVNGVYYPFAVDSGQKGSPFHTRLTVEKVESQRAAGRRAIRNAQRRRKMRLTSIGSPATLVPAALTAQEIKFDSDTISGLGARNIGSAQMSGRVTSLAGVRENGRLTVYVGSASGGVWKSVNDGTTYKPMFDKQPVQSIGAIAIDPSTPKTVWVGTGEAWTRNSTSIGDGIYKSTDGGDNWTSMGLKETERISKILVDPKDGNTVYACAPGKLWSDSDDRGVYKTTDGGKSWTKILKGGNASTGCSMMTMSSRDSKTLYAGMWDFRRRGWTFRSGGESPTSPSASAFYKTVDGGATWTDLNEKSAQGLPAKPWGRIAVAAAPSNPDVVYALIESTRSALFPLRRRRQNLAGARSQPDDGVASILFRESHRGSEG